MAVQVEIHSTARRAALIVGFAVVFCGILIGARALSRRDAAPSENQQLGGKLVSAERVLLTPVVSLQIPDAQQESAWSVSLAKAIGGVTETGVEGGRVDVLNDRFAVEVDRLDKWHEGIGQALHYSDGTGKLPCLALIVDSDLWPLNRATIEKIELVEKTCQPRGVKLILLRRASP